MTNSPTEDFLQYAREYAVPVEKVKDLAPLVDRLSQARIVMLGEASHGTHEFYEWRRLISEWLIVKHGFNFIAVEGDWPSCQTLNRSITSDQPKNAREALEEFRRWPTWMWANIEVLRLAEWLNQHNRTLESGRKPVGFHGLDVYSLFESIDVVLREVEKVNPFLARRVRHRYACFEPFQRDERSYARSLIQFPEGCEEQVRQALNDLLESQLFQAQRDGNDLFFDIVQNGRIIKNAEQYYRSMMYADDNSWNVRDRHMMETLDLLLEHYGPGSKAIVWAHNTHIGDYRATDMKAAGMVNIGGLAREEYGERQIALLGFGTHDGTVIASKAWEGPILSQEVPRAQKQSIESLLHDITQELQCDQFMMIFDDDARENALSNVLKHRAIGVVYDPAHEGRGNYVPTSLSRRYDAFFFIDRTRSLEPLIQGFDDREIPETWPIGQ